MTQQQFGGTGQTKLRVGQAYVGLNRLYTTTRYKYASGWSAMVSTTYQYDAVGRLTGLIHRNGAGSTLAQYTYTFDAASRMASQVVNTVATTYSYDDEDNVTLKEPGDQRPLLVRIAATARSTQRSKVGALKAGSVES